MFCTRLILELLPTSWNAQMITIRAKCRLACSIAYLEKVGVRHSCLKRTKLANRTIHCRRYAVSCLKSFRVNSHLHLWELGHDHTRQRKIMVMNVDLSSSYVYPYHFVKPESLLWSTSSSQHDSHISG